MKKQENGIHLLDELKETLTMEVTGMAQKEVKALVQLCAFDYGKLATFPLPKTGIKRLTHTTIIKHVADTDVNDLLATRIKRLTHTTIIKHVADTDVNDLLALPFSEGRVDGVRDDTGKKYDLVNNINDYQKEVHKKTHDKNKDIIIAVATELNKIMIALAKAPWKEVADTSDDAIINGKIMKFLGRDGIETANA